MAGLRVLVLAASLFSLAVPAKIVQYDAAQSFESGPVAHVRNGTLRGLNLPFYKQNLFLGVPFAEPPVGNLRFRHPVPYRSRWNASRDATVRSPSCPGYAGFDIGLSLGEDCLTLDIVRPEGATNGSDLPVLVWIYGGGFTAGGSADPRYNTTYMVQQSVAIGKPVIAVSINYRVGGFGFLASNEVVAAGVANIGLFDQRLALKWIRENIGAFGGDPDAVTIWGESAGGFSVGYHLVGFDGDNQGLFRAAILESGNALGPAINSPGDFNSNYQPYYDHVVDFVGCGGALDTLDCLRKAPFERLFGAFYSQVYTPILDGTFLKRLPSESFAKSLVADVAILAGSKTDEGTATFFGPRGTLNNDSDIFALLKGMEKGLANETVEEAMRLYPDDPAVGCPFNTGSERFEDHGFMYKRGAAIVGDAVIHAGRRQHTEFFANRTGSLRKSVYSYRFDQSPWDNSLTFVSTDPPVYSTHYAEVCFVFNNPSVSNTNWIGPYANFTDLANYMSRSWVAFANSLDSNFDGSTTYWPDYSDGNKNIVFSVGNITIEKDDWRMDQLRFWQGNWPQIKT
ncbi:carboxylesterase family protein [Colletotrichum plurivorum]|uniref:Carboxylic ester hydrolase n=1 Tax=Colletotrichum plurivorum TaxID=2175906 RepID=A0A8H6MZG3_9PEZI|nr:carboxylesterase family protein [Colletotrichum plurivorum]